MKIHKQIIATASMVFCAIACDMDKLDSPPLQLTEDSYFNQKSQFDLEVYNMYSQMTDWYWFRAQDYLHPMYFLPGDDITESNGVYSEWESFNGIGPADGNATYFFQSTYELIQRANTVIEKTSQAKAADFPDPFLDLSFLKWEQGEGLFLRALANFKLFNMYGTAPLVIERLNGNTLNVPRSEGTQLLDQAILDLQAAAELLPPSWPDADRGRATKNSAYGLLVKCLVFRGDYNKTTADYTAAVEAYNQITATLVTNYSDNFNAMTENNSESLFEFQASAAPGQDNVWLYNDGPWRGVEVMSTYWGFYQIAPNNGAISNRRGDVWHITRKMNDAYGTDPRIDYFVEDNRAFTKYGKEGLDFIKESYIPGSQNNPRILRFADVKLLAAEALLLSGGSKTTAIQLINDVRQRAKTWATGEGLDVSTLDDRDTGEADADVIMGWIEDERVMELCGEEQIRWFDLKRWDARGYKSLSGWDGSDAHFSTDLAGTFMFEYPKHLLLPIPFSESSRNPAIVGNNPGY